MSDQWTWWRGALAGAPGPVTDGGIESGFYRTKASKLGGWVPIAIWRDADNTFRCRSGVKPNTQMLTDTQAEERWTYICQNPVSRDDYMVAYETGTWPDGSPTQAPSTNMPDDPYAAWKAEMDDKLGSVREWMATTKIDDKVKADRARNSQAELLALIKRGEGMHGEEKAPVLAQAKGIDAKYLPHCKGAKEIADRLRHLYGAFAAAEEDRLRREAQAAFEAEQKRVAAERERIATEQAKLMEVDPIMALTSPVPQMPVAPVAPAAVKVSVGGGVGRAAGLKDDWYPVITDYAAATAYFADHADVKAVIDKLAKAAVKASKAATKIPGVEAHSRRVAA